MLESDAKKLATSIRNLIRRTLTRTGASAHEMLDTLIAFDVDRALVAYVERSLAITSSHAHLGPFPPATDHEPDHGKTPQEEITIAIGNIIREQGLTPKEARRVNAQIGFSFAIRLSNAYYPTPVSNTWIEKLRLDEADLEAAITIARVNDRIDRRR